MDKLIQGSLEYLKAFSGTRSHKSESQLEVARKTKVENLKRQISKLKDDDPLFIEAQQTQINSL